MCAQRRLRSASASAQSYQSSLSAWRNLGSLVQHWAQSEDFDQTGRMHRLIRVFAGRTSTCLFCHSAAQFYVSDNTTSSLIPSGRCLAVMKNQMGGWSTTIEDCRQQYRYACYEGNHTRITKSHERTPNTQISMRSLIRIFAWCSVGGQRHKVKR